MGGHAFGYSCDLRDIDANLAALESAQNDGLQSKDVALNLSQAYQWSFHSTNLIILLTEIMELRNRREMLLTNSSQAKSIPPTAQMY